MQVLILCAGKATRFGGVAKQLLSIGKESILERIVRQVRERGQEPTIIARSGEFNVLGSKAYFPAKYEVTCDTFLSTEILWEDRTVILLGDTIYSNEAMDKIFECDQDIMIFGDKWEIFAVSFDNPNKVKIALTKAITQHPGKLSQFYYALIGIPAHADRGLKDQMENWPNFHYIDDWTRDIDLPSEYTKAWTELVRRGVLDSG